MVDWKDTPDSPGYWWVTLPGGDLTIAHVCRLDELYTVDVVGFSDAFSINDFPRWLKIEEPARPGRTRHPVGG